MAFAEQRRPLPHVLKRVVTIDGPAGAGKSTVARRLAESLGWRYLDTGALYRCVALVAHEKGLAEDDAEALGALTERLVIRQDPEGRTFVGERDVSSLIRTPEISSGASKISAHPQVRTALVQVQRGVADEGDLVCEGRDMGTVIFPEATLKIFLTAETRTRAERRHADLAAKGQAVDINELQLQLEERDHRDSNRSVAPLQQLPDQVRVDTSTMTIPEVLEQLRDLVAARCGLQADPSPHSEEAD